MIAEALSSATYTLKDIDAVQELYHRNGWTDGLPIVPPTSHSVHACLEKAGVAPDYLVGVEPVRDQPVTAEKLAINAVMAGCTAVHFPVVLAAWAALLQPEFLLHGATSSTGGCAVMLVINGPVRHEIGATGTFNVLGNSNRATAVIGRAIRLALINILDVRPGEIDRATLGHPGKFTYCIAEDEEDSPWLPLSETRGAPKGASAVTVMAALAPRQIMNEWTTQPEEILETFAAEIRANQRHYSIYSGNYAIVVAKQLRDHFRTAGWSKADIGRHMYERARIHRREWADVGKKAIVEDKGDIEYKALRSPESLLVIAGGGPAGGFGSVIPPWLAHRTTAVTMPLDIQSHKTPLPNPSNGGKPGSTNSPEGTI